MRRERYGRRSRRLCATLLRFARAGGRRAGEGGEGWSGGSNSSLSSGLGFRAWRGRSRQPGRVRGARPHASSWLQKVEQHAQVSRSAAQRVRSARTAHQEKARLRTWRRTTLRRLKILRPMFLAKRQGEAETVLMSSSSSSKSSSSRRRSWRSTSAAARRTGLKVPRSWTAMRPWNHWLRRSEMSWLKNSDSKTKKRCRLPRARTRPRANATAGAESMKAMVWTVPTAST